MPLVAHTKLPTFRRLEEEGYEVISCDRAYHQDIRELHIGLLNMMPDKALAATERQFFRLVGESNPIAQFYMHPFTLPQLERGSTASEHVRNYYETFDRVREQGLDALIITGANVVGTDLADQPFIGLNRRGPLGQMLGDHLALVGFRPDIIAWSETYHVARELVAQGLGVTIADDVTARSGAMGNVRRIPLRPTLKFSVKALHLDSMPLSIGARSFIKHLGTVLKQFLADD